MSDPNITRDTVIVNSSNRWHSLNEAIELMKMSDEMPSGNLNWNWVNRNGNRVSIGYNTQINKIKL